MIKREIINPDKKYKWGWFLCIYTYKQIQMILTSLYTWWKKRERKRNTNKNQNKNTNTDLSVWWVSQQWVGPGPPAPLGSAWRPQPVIWNIYVWFFYFSSAKVFGHHHHFMLKSIYHPALNLKSDIWNMKPCEILLFSWLGIRNEIFSGWFSPSLSISSTFVIFLHVLHDIEA